MAGARLVLHEKQVDEDGSIIEMKIWSLYPQGVKYSLVYIREGKRVLGYDNAHGQDHRHCRGESEPYRFTNIRTLLRDFQKDLDRLKEEGE